MKKTTTIIFLTLILSVFSITPVYAKKYQKPQVENNIQREIKRLIPLNGPRTRFSIVTPQTTQVPPNTPNLISNPSIESTDSSGNPIGWSKGGYGTNTRQFTYPTIGIGGTKALRTTITNYSTGDAKWYFNDVAVTAGSMYEFSDYSLGNSSSTITVRYKTSSGTFIYKDIAQVAPNTTYTKNSVKITIPSDVISLTIFHLINSNGILNTDEYALMTVTPTAQNNLVPNGDFETTDTNNMPIGWKIGGWGSNTKIATYPVTNQTKSTGASVEITNYTSGDAKWYFTPISIFPGTYTYSDQFITNATSTVTAQFNNIDGTTSYRDLLKIPPAPELTSSSIDFSIGSEVSKVTIFHLIQSQSKLTIDNVSIIKKSNPIGIFTTGAITLRFDDGWLSQYENAIPKMQSSGIKGVFYIVSRQKADDGFPAFMSTNQIQEIYTMGHEIGAHTRTHPFLSQLSSSTQQDEIGGSRDDLLALHIGPMTSFAFPYGDYNNTTLSILKSAGFTNSVSTIDGFATQTSDKYQLERRSVVASTTLAEVKQWIDTTEIQKKWLILTFHEVNDSGAEYSTSPVLFNQIIDYIVAKNIPVITPSVGINSIQ